MNYVVGINKPLVLSSSDVVIKCRNVLSKALGYKIKCGHTGTLDPAASGVLVLGFGKATRLFDYMQKKSKTYIARFEFGQTTDTLDRDGIVVQENGILPDLNCMKNALNDFIGEISQVPPAYSAVNINGQRAYQLARAGKEVVIEPKIVTISSIKILDYALQDSKVKSVDLLIECGSGTYIRSICRDLANSLNTIAYMSSLVRIKCGNYSLEDCVELNEFLENPTKYLQPCINAVSAIMPICEVPDNDAKKLKNGIRIQILDKNYDFFGVLTKGELLGIAKKCDDGLYKLETYLLND